jgi:GntR family transcriptional regulator
VVDVSRDVDRAKYRLIADELRAAINSGTYGPGDRLPGENALMSRYGVARMTARQALAVLQNEGLMTTRKGAGVFVRDFRPIVREGIARLSRERWASGRGIWDADQDNRSLTVDRIKVREKKATGYVADTFGLDDGDTVVIRDRRYLLDDRPVLLAVSSLPASIARGTPIAEKDAGPGGVYARLAELGLAPAHFREDLRARMPSDDEAATLSLNPGTPVITIARTAYTADGRAVEVNEMTLDASAYVLRYAFDA